MKKLLFVVFLYCSHTSAQTIVSGFHSKHQSGSFCEANYGIGYRQDSGEWAGWGAGVYKNSLCRPSVYIAREWRTPIVNGFDAGVMVAGATGYLRPVVAAIMPELILTIGSIEYVLIVQPFNVRYSPAFAAVQIRFKF
jgi:hypothetical protein